MVIKCNKCNKDKPEERFEMRTSRHKTKKRFRRKTCMDCRNSVRREEFHNNKLDHYVVYYLPTEHYCGITNNPKKRMSGHKSKGKYTDDWRLLFCCNTKLEAQYTEALYQSVLGIKGLSQAVDEK